MKRNYTNILQLIALLFVSILCCTQNVSAAYTLAVYPNANPTDIQHFDFVQKPSNVPDEMRVVANFSGNANDYSFWVGQDYAKDAYSADVPLSNVIQIVLQVVLLRVFIQPILQQPFFSRFYLFRYR